jgi:hypothetical protein
MVPFIDLNLADGSFLFGVFNGSGMSLVAKAAAFSAE